MQTKKSKIFINDPIQFLINVKEKRNTMKNVLYLKHEKAIKKSKVFFWRKRA